MLLHLVHWLLPEKMCQDMTNASAYNNAMKKVESYKLEGLELTLFNAEDQKLLVFFKED